MTQPSTAYRQGWAVRLETLAPDALRNPYAEGTEEHYDWAAGVARCASEIAAKGAGSEALTW